MKIKFSKVKREKWEWDGWYAWYPVFTRWRDGKRELVWLEYVDRMYCGGKPGERWVYEARA